MTTWGYVSMISRVPSAARVRCSIAKAGMSGSAQTADNFPSILQRRPSWGRAGMACRLGGAIGSTQRIGRSSRSMSLASGPQGPLPRYRSVPPAKQRRNRARYFYRCRLVPRPMLCTRGSKEAALKRNRMPEIVLSLGVAIGATRVRVFEAQPAPTRFTNQGAHHAH
jgi:hypothetical protein